MANLSWSGLLIPINVAPDNPELAGLIGMGVVVGNISRIMRMRKRAH